MDYLGKLVRPGQKSPRVCMYKWQDSVGTLGVCCANSTLVGQRNNLAGAGQARSGQVRSLPECARINSMIQCALWGVLCH